MICTDYLYICDIYILMYWLWTGPSYYPASVSEWKSITSWKHERTDFQRDYDRLIFSSPFRRLQNKTQVFPLPGSIFVHNRLTHSLEVSCVGRSLGNNVAKGLMQKYPDGSINFPEIGSIVSAACLAHDMGNPPFGHPERERSPLTSPKGMGEN